MIDFHCHLDLYSDPVSVVDRAIKENIYVLAVTTTPKAWEGTKNLIGQAKRIRIALGLHPELIGERHSEVDLLCSLIGETKYIGEIGLDGSPPHIARMPLQQLALNRILGECSTQGGRIMTLHSRGATSTLLDAVEEHPKAGTPILHWFSGTRHELQRAINLGCWFSVGPAMLRGQKGQALVSAMPKDRILTETDGPFARKGDSPLMPWDVKDAVVGLAQVWQASEEDAQIRLHTNFKSLLGPSFLIGH